MPLDMERTNEGVIKWVEKRVIPKNRTFVDEILKNLGLSHNDTKGIDTVGKDFAEQIRSMLVFDALIYNEDRHFGNFGVLRDNHTGSIIAPAPIFDNGLSLFCYAGKEDIPNLCRKNI